MRAARCLSLALISSMLLVSACAGHATGADVGAGFDTLDTESKESKENEKWFNSFYGKCHGIFGCSEDAGTSAGGGTGGMWGGSVGPTDAVSGHE